MITKGQVKISPISPSLSILLIPPDARANSMGNIGVATSSDVNSLFHNPSKIAFHKENRTFGLNYVPWFRNLISDSYFTTASYIDKSLGKNGVLGANFMFFSRGKFDLKDEENKDKGVGVLNSWSIKGAYSLQLNKYFSLGAELQFAGAATSSPDDLSLNSVNAFVGGLSGYFVSSVIKDLPFLSSGSSYSLRYRIGLNISNIGPKVGSNDGNNDYFSPTNMKLGGSFDFFVGKNTVVFSLELNKLLVPSVQPDGSHNDITPIFGMFKSFADAPGGFSEEMSEINIGTGVEYSYRNLVFARLGFFKESEMKGDRSFISTGMGFGIYGVRIDMSYMYSLSEENPALANTIRYSVSFDIDKIYDQF
ncbi:hypothetical protein JBKA6_1289 [Ichthyobacterium seriolicida]|uniref:Type IX secretion system protein PorV domain-containing protein n=1 Tax=Ichthyobacterium seriolicida TaxID=242600 RepID=A0A1J1E7J5_9FLAO|nr:hypothetical protein JBKA6_1289 [Ichthyobacterium seriolicida]